MTANTTTGMTTKHSDGSRGRRRSLWKLPASLAVFCMLALFVASRIVEGWRWHPGAFFVVGALVFIFGLVYELMTRNRAISYSAAVAIALITSFGLLWGNLVQMADVNPSAALYFAVPLVALIGAVIARLRPSGMARALFVTAIAQALALATVLILLINRNPQVSAWSAPELRGFAGNAIDAILFAVSGLLFRKAARAAGA